MYDKFGRGLRVETTINATKDFRVFRRPEGQPEQPQKWRALPRGLAHLDRRAAVAKAANQRYLTALAAVDEKTPLREVADKLCRPIRHKGRHYRALNPWSPLDGALLQAINRGEFALNGMRNRDLRALLFPGKGLAAEQRRRAGRASGVLVTALLVARQSDTDQLSQLAA